MKIKIITYTFSQNIGAILQAYSLREYLKKITKKDVIYTNYQPLKLYLRENFSFLKKMNIYEFATGIQKFIKILNWKKNNFKIQRYQNSYDGEELLNIFGSDEIWNYSNPFFNYQKFYYGFGKSETKIAYAVSIGNAELKNLTNILEKDIKKNLLKFKYITVRDTNTQKFVKRITKKNVPIVVDPIFLIRNKLVDLKPKNYLNKNEYILIYGKIKNIHDIRKIKTYADQKKREIVSIIFKNDWADKNILSVDPWQFQIYIKNSNTVFTSMFHGVMFSVKFNKQFWISFDAYRVNKLGYFLKNLKLEKRYINEKIHLNDKIDYSRLRPKLNIWIEKSKNLLKKNIK